MIYSQLKFVKFVLIGFEQMKTEQDQFCCIVSDT